MSKQSRFTEEEKLEIALAMLSGQESMTSVCRKYGISSSYAYRLKDRALEILREGIGHPAGKPDAETERLRRRVADLEQLAGDQALAIRALKKRRESGRS